MVSQNEKTISPVEYLKILFRRKWLFITPVVIGLTLGICAGLLLPKEYRSSTIILVEEGKTDNPLFSRLAVSTTVGQRMNSIRESILGWNSMVKLVKRLNLDKDIKNKVEFENLITQELRRNIRIRLRGENIIDLSYVGKDPQQTQAIVKTITDIFIERNVEIQNKETADAITFIEEQLKLYLGKIKSAEIAQLQEQLDAFLIDSTEKHPVVKKLQEQIDIKKKELKERNLEYIEGDDINLQATGPIIEEIKKALDTLEGTKQDVNVITPDQGIAKVMLLEKLDNVMARDEAVNEGIYNELLQRLETAKITQRLQSSKEGTRYTILDPPRVPLFPIKPNKPFVAFMGLFLGLVAGVALVVLTEFLDKSFLDVQDAKEYFGVPLLGAISKIATPYTIREEREKERWRISVTVLCSLLAIILTYALSKML